MTEFTRPATWQDVLTLVRYLQEVGAEFALVGGYAIAAHGFNRFSEDIDILVEASPENSTRWVAALSRLPDGAEVPLLDLQGLLKTKQGLRPKDQMDAKVLSEAIRRLEHQRNK